MKICLSKRNEWLSLWTIYIKNFSERAGLYLVYIVGDILLYSIEIDLGVVFLLVYIEMNLHLSKLLCVKLRTQ